MLKDLLRNQNNGEWITEGKEKIALDQAIAETKGVMTIRKAEIVKDSKKNREYAICIADELPNHFFFCGSVMVALLQRLIEKIGSADMFKVTLEEEGLPVLIEKKRSEKTGNVYTSVTLL